MTYQTVIEVRFPELALQAAPFGLFCICLSSSHPWSTLILDLKGVLHELNRHFHTHLLSGMLQAQIVPSKIQLLNQLLQLVSGHRRHPSSCYLPPTIQTPTVLLTSPSSGHHSSESLRNTIQLHQTFSQTNAMVTNPTFLRVPDPSNRTGQLTQHPSVALDQTVARWLREGAPRINSQSTQIQLIAPAALFSFFDDAISLPQCSQLIAQHLANSMVRDSPSSTSGLLVRKLSCWFDHRE